MEKQFSAQTSEGLRAALALADMKLMERSMGLHIPECPVCWEDFDERPHLPRLLGCGHTVCEPCVGHLPVWQDLSGHQSVTCPECRRNVMWRGVQSLPKNYTLLRLLSALGTASPRGSTPSSSLLLPGPSKPKGLHRGLGGTGVRYNLGLALLAEQLQVWHQLGRCASMLSRLSVLLGLVVGLLLLVPLCLAYLLLGWGVALLALLLFCSLVLASAGFGFAGFVSFLCVHWLYAFQVKSPQ